MKKEEFVSIDYHSYSSSDSLQPDDRDLLIKAREVLPSSYAPYSLFHVAAAVQLSNGQVVTGTNQENAAYPSGLCAERVAVFAAMHQFPNSAITTIAITAESENFEVDHPIAPCGACRQVLLEYEMNQKSPIKVILQGKTGRILVIDDAVSLLPFFFHEQGLKK
ncbi:MAG: cytidine deaminase [Flavobacteriales bacterium]|nr:cytidine deaminase [Flavobacteriales bacterium]